jgi:hypothetical protein
MNEPKTHCQICGREIKSKAGLIAHHGYQRPGDGWQTASCFGARYAPYEVACDAIQPCIDMIGRYIECERELLTSLVEQPPETLTQVRAIYGRKPATYQRPEGFKAGANEYRISIPHTYENEHSSRCSAHDRNIKGSEMTVKELQKRLEDWRPVQLNVLEVAR